MLIFEKAPLPIWEMLYSILQLQNLKDELDN